MAKIKLSESESEALVKRILRDYERDSRGRVSWEQNQEKWYKLYRPGPAATVDFPWDGAANLHLPLVMSTVEAMQARLYAALFSAFPFVKAVPIGEGDTEIADRRTQRMHYIVTEELPLKSILDEGNLDMLLGGTATYKIYWRRDKAKERFTETVPEQSIETTDTPLLGPVTTESVKMVTHQRSRVVDKSKAMIDVVDMASMFYPLHAQGFQRWQGCDHVIHRLQLTWPELQQRKHSKDYDNINDVLKAKSAPEKPTLRQIHERTLEGVSPEGEYEFYDVLEWYGALEREELQEDDTGEERKEEERQTAPEEVIVTLSLDTEQILRAIPLTDAFPHGHRPFVPVIFSKSPRRLQGIGLPEKLESLQDELNAQHNQMTDRGTLENLPFFFFKSTGLGLIPDLTQARPGEGIAVDDPASIIFPQFQRSQSYGLMQENILHGEAEKVSQISDFSMGRSPDRPNAPRTARGTIAILQQSNVGFSRITDLLSEPLRELLYQLDALYTEFKPDLEFRLLGPGNAPMGMGQLNPDEQEQRFDYQFIINPDPAFEREINLQLFELLMQLPQIQMNPRAQRILARQLYESLGKKNFDEIWPMSMDDMPPELLMLIQQERARTAPGQAQAGQMMPGMGNIGAGAVPMPGGMG